MSASPIRILPTDTRWPGPYSIEEGPECLCSRCEQPILEPEIAIRAWPQDDPNRYEYRFHPACLGCQAYDPRDDDWEPDDQRWPPMPGDDENDEPIICPSCGEEDCEASCTSALVQEDRASEADVPDLGHCCVCRQSCPQVRNLLTLPRRAPVPGTGWGCVVCGLPPNGAVAVVCDACLEQPLQEVCSGFEVQGERAAYASLAPEPFAHDRTRHPEEGTHAQTDA